MHKLYFNRNYTYELRAHYLNEFITNIPNLQFTFIFIIPMHPPEHVLKMLHI